MNLKLYVLILLVGALFGAFMALHFQPDHACPAIVKQEVQVNKVIKKKEFRYPNGTVEVQTVVEKNSHTFTETESVKEDRYAIGLKREYDFTNQKDIYELEIYRRFMGAYVGFSFNSANQIGIGILKTF